MEIRFIGWWKLDFSLYFKHSPLPDGTHFLRNTFYNQHIVRRVWHELESLLNSWFQGVRLKRVDAILRCLIDYSLPLNDVDCCYSIWSSSLGRWCVVYTCDVVSDVSFCKWKKIYNPSMVFFFHWKRWIINILWIYSLPTHKWLTQFLNLWWRNEFCVICFTLSFFGKWKIKNTKLHFYASWMLKKQIKSQLLQFCHLENQKKPH